MYAYVEKRKSPPTIKQAIGLATHSAVEANFAQKMVTETDLPMEAVLDTFSDEWELMAPDVEPAENLNIGQGKDSGLSLVRLHHKQVAPNIQPVLVEQQVQFNVDGIPYSGYLDLVDSTATVRDTKTASRRPGKWALRDFLINMTGYALGYRVLRGAREKAVALDYLVRTKKPQYLPVISEGPVSDEDIRIFAGIVGEVSANIEAGRFPPNGIIGNPPACSWCGYRSICPYGKRAT